MMSKQAKRTTSTANARMETSLSVHATPVSEAVREKIVAFLDARDTGYAGIERGRTLLREAAALIPDFPAYQSLCAQTMRSAWEADRASGKRTAHNRKVRWMRLFPYFAAGHGLNANLRIRALNHFGDYVCELLSKKNRGARWAMFAQMGREFGIFPNQLEHLAERAEKRMKQSKSKYHDALQPTA